MRKVGVLLLALGMIVMAGCGGGQAVTDQTVVPSTNTTSTRTGGEVTTTPAADGNSEGNSGSNGSNENDSGGGSDNGGSGDNDSTAGNGGDSSDGGDSGNSGSNGSTGGNSSDGSNGSSGGNNPGIGNSGNGSTDGEVQTMTVPDENGNLMTMTSYTGVSPPNFVLPVYPSWKTLGMLEVVDGQGVYFWEGNYQVDSDWKATAQRYEQELRAMGLEMDVLDNDSFDSYLLVVSGTIKGKAYSGYLTFKMTEESGPILNVILGEDEDE